MTPWHVLARGFANAKFRGRNLRYRSMFRQLEGVSLGHVIDVGGGRLVDLDVVSAMSFDSWSVVEVSPHRFGTSTDSRIRRVIADGAHLPVRRAVFDTALSIQVLEHVFDPFRMLAELVDAVRPGGRIVVVVPQTANVHELPHHYQNFTRYWLEEAARRLDMDIETYEPLGGSWSSIASRLVLQYATVLRIPGHHDPSARRRPMFWILTPLAAIVTLVTVPLALVLATADIEEEPNNHLVILRKPSA